jgi:hypothetical protein
MDEWLTEARDALARASGLPAEELELTNVEIATLLDLARIAAHESGDRTNAPLLCYLVGLARRSAGVEDLAVAVRQSSS